MSFWPAHFLSSFNSNLCFVNHASSAIVCRRTTIIQYSHLLPYHFLLLPITSFFLAVLFAPILINVVLFVPTFAPPPIWSNSQHFLWAMRSKLIFAMHPHHQSSSSFWTICAPYAYLLPAACCRPAGENKSVRFKARCGTRCFLPPQRSKWWCNCS